MAKQYLIRKTHWLGTRFSVEEADGRVLYEATARGFTLKFRAPGIEEPIFEARSTGLFSSLMAVVESAVEYELAYYRGYGISHTCGLILNQAKETIGFLITATHWEAYLEWRKENETQMERRNPEEVMKQAYRLRVGFRESMRRATLPTRTYHLVNSAERISATCEVPKDRKSLSITIVDATERYFDDRLVMVLGVRCLMGQNHNNGA